MDIKEFARVLSTFVDTPADVNIEKGVFVAQIREDLVEGRLVQRQGVLHIVENDTEQSAVSWIVNRVARMQMLADRILTQIPEEKNFVTPSGLLLDQLDQVEDASESSVDDVAEKILKVVDRRPAGTSSVLYLTSDAGEGKTTLIHHIAREQANRFKAKASDWLLVPVSLGGRTFMRFDDVIVGALVNKLRFQFLYYDAFVELVKLGIVVPALDGFEEMFVEGTAGDAVSALGNLMKTLDSSGSVMIAARKAYFEYKNLETQARLFDSLDGESVSFGRMSLNRWDECQFMEYAEKRGVKNAQEIYNDFEQRLSRDHPLLTRAVLVRRLLDVAADTKGREELISHIQENPQVFFRQFVGSIIAREANEKWIDKVGDPAGPLISEDEHYELLSSIAQEMWGNKSESLRAEVLELIAELFADSKKKDKVVTNQIVERIKQHALIVGLANNQFTFDHQEFFHFFLGEALGRLICNGNKPAIKHAFKQGVLPSLAVETAARYVRQHELHPKTVVQIVNEICQTEPRASYIKENLSGMIMRFIDYAGGENVVVTNGFFSSDSLAHHRISNVQFKECYFQRTSLTEASISNCQFIECEFECIELANNSIVADAVFDKCDFRSVLPSTEAGSTSMIYAPEQIPIALRSAGFSILSDENAEPEQAIREPDREIAQVEKLCHIFLRSTGVNERTLLQRFGQHSKEFFKNVIPKLLDAEIIKEVEFRGAGKQKRFQLAVSLQSVQEAVESANGEFATFLNRFQS